VCQTRHIDSIRQVGVGRVFDIGNHSRRSIRGVVWSQGLASCRGDDVSAHGGLR
jgi:hypothetical protein